MNKVIPTERQTIVNVFLINLFPFNFDKWAPKYPPVRQLLVGNIFDGIGDISQNNRSMKFQKSQRWKSNLWLNKINSKGFIKVPLQSPVPEEIEPFKMPIKN